MSFRVHDKKDDHWNGLVNKQPNQELDDTEFSKEMKDVGLIRTSTATQANGQNPITLLESHNYFADTDANNRQMVPVAADGNQIHQQREPLDKISQSQVFVNPIKHPQEVMIPGLRDEAGNVENVQSSDPLDGFDGNNSVLAISQKSDPGLFLVGHLFRLLLKKAYQRKQEFDESMNQRNLVPIETEPSHYFKGRNHIRSGEEGGEIVTVQADNEQKDPQNSPIIPEGDPLATGNDEHYPSVNIDDDNEFRRKAKYNALSGKPIYEYHPIQQETQPNFGSFVDKIGRHVMEKAAYRLYGKRANDQTTEQPHDDLLLGNQRSQTAGGHKYTISTASHRPFVVFPTLRTGTIEHQIESSKQDHPHPSQHGAHMTAWVTVNYGDYGKFEIPAPVFEWMSKHGWQSLLEGEQNEMQTRERTRQ